MRLFDHRLRLVLFPLVMRKVIRHRRLRFRRRCRLLLVMCVVFRHYRLYVFRVNMLLVVAVHILTILVCYVLRVDRFLVFVVHEVFIVSSDVHRVDRLLVVSVTMFWLARMVECGRRVRVDVHEHFILVLVVHRILVVRLFVGLLRLNLDGLHC